VVAIAPAVIDVLNMAKQMRHHYSAYGFFSKAIKDYQDMQIFCRLDSPEGRNLAQLVDPYAYKDRFSMPKLLINSCGDQFFLPDAGRFYVGELPGQTYLRYCPNTDHGLSGSDAVEVLLNFYRSQVGGLAMPQFTWSIDDQDRIIVRTQTRSSQVRLWQATNPHARDFRLQTIGPAWSSSVLQASEPDLYIAQVARPQSGWKAFFVELVFDGTYASPIRLTTPVHVVPSCLPYAYKLGLDEDWDIDVADIAILASQWLTAGPIADIAPICGDGWVDLQDYALLASVASAEICR
jgi:PhoPQ-activated pathogenicity-related protein